MEGQKPVKRFKAGGVQASIWENVVKRDGREVVLATVRIERRYKDGEQFRSTNGFDVRDLPRVRLVAEKAYEFLELRERETA